MAAMHFSEVYTKSPTAAVAQSVKAFVFHAEVWLFESKPRQTLVVKTSIDSSTAKCSATGVSAAGHRR